MALTALYYGNDHLVILDSLRDAATGGFVNGATATLTILDSIGAEVSGQTWPAAMSYVSASDGQYSCILENTVDVEVLEQYRAVIEVDTGSLQARWDVPCIGRYRTS